MDTCISLRNLMDRNKKNYQKADGTVNPLWFDEGSAWTIQDYYGIVGSLEDFSADDWAAANEAGWTKLLVEILCEEDEQLNQTQKQGDISCIT